MKGRTNSKVKNSTIPNNIVKNLRGNNYCPGVYRGIISVHKSAYQAVITSTSIIAAERKPLTRIQTKQPV